MSIYENKWSNIKTFDELCYMGFLYINDIIKTFPIYKTNNNDNKNLFELVDEYNWIQTIIYKYNLLQYFTQSSQPGKCEIFNINNNNVEWYQRAFITGYMDKNRAEYIYYKMIRNENYIICVEDINECVDDIYTPCTIYIEYKIIDNRKYYLSKDCKSLISADTFVITSENYNKLYYTCNTHVLNNIKDIKKSNNNNYSIFRNEYEKYLHKLNNKYYNKFNKSYLIYFCAMDRRWNYNNTFWSDLLKYLEEYNTLIS